MSEEPIIAPAAYPPAPIQADAPGVEVPPPSVEQQRAADELFTDEQARTLAALMAAQMGVGIVQMIADNVRSDEEEPEVPPRKKDEPKE